MPRCGRTCRRSGSARFRGIVGTNRTDCSCAASAGGSTTRSDAETAELLERAVDGYRAIGNVAGEIAAGVELVYVLRNQGRCEALPVFLARAANSTRPVMSKPPDRPPSAGRCSPSSQATTGRGRPPRRRSPPDLLEPRLECRCRLPPDHRPPDARQRARDARGGRALRTARRRLQRPARAGPGASGSPATHRPLWRRATRSPRTRLAARSTPSSSERSRTMVLATAGRIDEAAERSAAHRAAASGPMSAPARRRTGRRRGRCSPPRRVTTNVRGSCSQPRSPKLRSPNRSDGEWRRGGCPGLRAGAVDPGRARRARPRADPRTTPRASPARS